MHGNPNRVRTLSLAVQRLNAINAQKKLTLTSVYRIRFAWAYISHAFAFRRRMLKQPIVGLPEI